MKKHLCLSIFTAMTVMSIGSPAAHAGAVDAVEVKDAGIRLYINTQQRSLYQVALLSGISVAELRQLNKGYFEQRDSIKAGESILLPAQSSLFPKEVVQENEVTTKFGNLPALGSNKDDKGPVITNDQVMETHVATALQTLAQQDWKELTSDKIKDRVETEAQSRLEGYARGQVRSQLIDPVQKAAEDFLGKFGTAKVNLTVSDKGSLRGSSLELFSPWYDSERMVTFTQVSVRDYDHRTIGNFGVGQRWDVADKSWLLGYNFFFDHDFDRSHNRLGVGVEAWADYLKLAINYYTPLSDWKDSKDFDNYLERAARGFDIRAQGYLPSYPHFGASLMYEQYFGDEVALFGKDKLQKNPRAVTIGIDYTPVPLFTIKGQHKQGQDGKKEAQVDITMNYRIGVPLNDQLDPDKVAVARTLKGSRYDLVDRNNNIILEYKQQKLSLDLASFTFPLIEGLSVDLTTTSNVTSAEQIKRFDWYKSSTELVQSNEIGRDKLQLRNDAHGIVWEAGDAPNAIYTHSRGWSFTVPNYVFPDDNARDASSKDPNKYTIAAKLDDTKGRSAISNTVEIIVRNGNFGIINTVDSLSEGIENVGPVKVYAYLGKLNPTVPYDLTNLQSNNFDPFNEADTTQGTKIDQPTWRVVYKDRVDADGNPLDATCSATVIDNCLSLIPSTATVKGTVQDSQGVANSDIDQYELTVNSKNLQGEFLVSAEFKTPGNSLRYNPTIAPYLVSFGENSNIPGSIQVWRDGVMLVSTSSGNAVITDEPMVGYTYEVKVLNDKESDITSNVPIEWALVGSNTACGDNAIINGRFVVQSSKSEAVKVADISTKAKYTIPVNGLSLATSGEDIYGKSDSITKPAFCGDQGFKLKVIVAAE